ncbi:uncharacterized protein LOC128551680 isoform X2 [Mercenaria mercenaria]|uniref:uncharacterized protein LOC128551680 isoform X2 n=1 Tax=Mercenaria mercenaria TaxID=6596 RepID=UPI00234E42E4|nr:uncharacterized protein LOC128551680 isoform X2 [Mercenaria mercenaria]
MEFVRIFLHWIFFPGCMMWIKLILMLACIDGIEDVEQQQVFQRSELPKQYILQNKLKFKVLQQPSICSYRNLTSCHTDSHLHEAYYEQCYSDACPKEKYFCLNNPSGNTIHLCGQAYTWKKRSRNIAVFDTVVSNYVDVYKIDCPLGYFQSNRRNAFTKCVKDESLVIVQNATNQRRALGRCNLKKKYCSTKGVILFELGSDKDACLDAKYDLNITCSETAELMPNCNCAPKCRAFEEREWSGSFMCRTIGENATDPEDTTQDRERVTQVTESYEPSSGQTVHQANNEVDIGIKGLDKDLSAVDNKIQNTDNYESNHLLMTIGLVTIIIAVILAVVVGIFVSVFVVKHRHIDGGFANYSTVSQGDSVDDQSVQSAVEDAGNTNKDTKKSGQVNKISSTKIKKTTYHVHTNNATLNFNQEHQGTRNLEIQNASESIDIEACLENVPENKPSLLPPQMQNLKVLELETSQPDSGIHTTDQTYEKTQQ